MKSLTKWYDDGLSDRDKGVEIFNQAEDGLKAVKKWFNIPIYEIQGVIVFYMNSLQMVNFKMKYLEITTYAKTHMKWCV